MGFNSHKYFFFKKRYEKLYMSYKDIKLIRIMKDILK